MSDIFIDNDWEDDNLSLDDFLSINDLEDKMDYDFDINDDVKKIITSDFLNIQDLTLKKIKLD
jgi:hypothetical protein